MRSENYSFRSSILTRLPQLIPYCDRIEKTEFQDEVSKLSQLVDYMFKNAQLTNPYMNRLIIYTLDICILKAIECERGFILLFNEGILSPAFTLNRSVFELWAAAFYVGKTVKNFCNTRNKVELAKIADKLFAGTLYPAQLPWGEPSAEKPIHISTMIKELEQEYPGSRQIYTFLCEYCHPNFLYDAYARIATLVSGAWENPRFLESIATALEKQLSSLEQALLGIKTSTKAISEMCLKEYGIY